MKILDKKILVIAGLGAGTMAAVAFAAPLSLITTVFNNSFLQTGVGLSGVPNSGGTYYFDRYNEISDPTFPALHAYTDLDAPASAFRAEATKGIDALIGDTVPDLSSEFDPGFADDYPSLIVADDGPMNVSGVVNDQDQVNRVAADLRGAIKLCGKSVSGDDECTNQAYLYLEDGTGDLVVKFGDGNGFVIASVASASLPFAGGAPVP